MIKNVLPSFFLFLRLVNPYMILIHFEHVVRPEPGSEASRFRPVHFVEDGCCPFKTICLMLPSVCLAFEDCNSVYWVVLYIG